MELSNCKNIEELIDEVYKQLQDKSFYQENYSILENVDNYLQKYLEVCKGNGFCADIEKWQDLEEEDIKVSIFNFFEFDYDGTLIEFE